MLIIIISEIIRFACALLLASTIDPAVIRALKEKPFPIQDHFSEWTQLPTSEAVNSRRLTLEPIHQEPLFSRDQLFTMEAGHRLGGGTTWKRGLGA